MGTELRHGYVGRHSPYDLAHKLQEIERAEANAHIISPDVYMPNAWSQARKAITINYFSTHRMRRRLRPSAATSRTRRSVTWSSTTDGCARTRRARARARARTPSPTYE